MFRIKIHNFQSIEDEELEVSGFTTGTGRSNIGKTALLRAVSSSVFNKPVGSFLRDPKKPVVVEVSGPDIEYTWRKGDKHINQYEIGGSLYDKCGTDGLVQLRPDWFKAMKIGDRETFPWYASQFSPLFLIDETSNKISEFFAEFCRIGLINKAIKLANSKKKEQEMLAKHLEAEIARLSGVIQQFEGLKKYKVIIKDLEDQKVSIESFELSIAQRSDFERKIIQSRKSLGTLGTVSRTVIPEFQGIEQAKSQFSFLFNASRKYENAVYSYYSLEAVKESDVPEMPEMPALVMLEKAAKLQKLVKNKVVPQIPSLPKVDEYHTIQQFVTKLDKLYDSYVNLNAKIKAIKHDKPEKEYYQYKVLLEKEKTTRIQNQIRSVLGKLESIDEEIKRIPKCPSCDRPLGTTDHSHQDSENRVNQ